MAAIPAGITAATPARLPEAVGEIRAAATLLGPSDGGGPSSPRCSGLMRISALTRGGVEEAGADRDTDAHAGSGHDRSLDAEVVEQGDHVMGVLLSSVALGSAAQRLAVTTYIGQDHGVAVGQRGGQRREAVVVGSPP